MSQSLVISCIMSVVSDHLLLLCPTSLDHLLYYVRSLWSSPVLCPQSLVISCTMSTVSVISCIMSVVSDHLLYYVRSLWFISCTMFASLWAFPVLCPSTLWSTPVLCPQSLVIPVLCPQSMVISGTLSTVTGLLLYYVCSLL
ncbi:unnamed protein product, partial [Staurois parvus]